jgi:hypothetical protein
MVTLFLHFLHKSTRQLHSAFSTNLPNSSSQNCVLPLSVLLYFLLLHFFSVGTTLHCSTQQFSSMTVLPSQCWNCLFLLPLLLLCKKHSSMRASSSLFVLPFLFYSSCVSSPSPRVIHFFPQSLSPTSLEFNGPPISIPTALFNYSQESCGFDTTPRRAHVRLLLGGTLSHIHVLHYICI